MQKFFSYLIYGLIFIGALNWGLVGIFNFDLVSFIFGEMTIATRIVYTMIGLSAIIGFIMCIIHYRDDHYEL